MDQPFKECLIKVQCLQWRNFGKSWLIIIIFEANMGGTEILLPLLDIFN